MADIDIGRDEIKMKRSPPEIQDVHLAIFADGHHNKIFVKAGIIVFARILQNGRPKTPFNLGLPRVPTERCSTGQYDNGIDRQRNLAPPWWLSDDC